MGQRYVFMSGIGKDRCLLSALQKMGVARMMRVLVVDDVAMNREIAAAFICAGGNMAVCAGSGPEAIAAANAGSFDVILMDVCMPVMDGLETTRRIRVLPGAAASTPIVAVTARVFGEQVDACRAVGMDGHLAKPFTCDTLLAALKHGVAAGLRRAPMRDEGGAPGVDLLVFDPATFAQTAALLKPDMVAAHLRTLAEKCETLLQDLQITDGLTRAGSSLAAAAHSLAGGGGLFGLERLAWVSRGFEKAVDAGSDDIPCFADALRATLSASLAELDRRFATAP